VKLGKAPANELPSINRYAAESSWVTFRWGPKFGEPYPNTQFPVEFAGNYYPQTVSTYRDPDETQKSVAAFTALIDRIAEPVIIQSWSSSGLLGYLTAIARPERVEAILAVETSVTAFDMISAEGRLKLAMIPIYIRCAAINPPMDRAVVAMLRRRPRACVNGFVKMCGKIWRLVQRPCQGAREPGRQLERRRVGRRLQAPCHGLGAAHAG
jgi:hypothetical protein